MKFTIVAVVLLCAAAWAAPVGFVGRARGSCNVGPAGYNFQCKATGEVYDDSRSEFVWLCSGRFHEPAGSVESGNVSLTGHDGVLAYTYNSTGVPVPINDTVNMFSVAGAVDAKASTGVWANTGGVMSVSETWTNVSATLLTYDAMISFVFDSSA